MSHVGVQRRPRGSAPLCVVALIGVLGLLGCGDDESSDATSVAFDPGAGLQAVVSCLTDEGWTETGSLSSGSAYTVDAESGTSVLLSVTESGEDPLLDKTTYTIASADPAGASLKVENIIGTISDDERGQIEACAAG